MVSRVRPLDQLRTTVDFDGEDYGLARIVVAVRVAMVISSVCCWRSDRTGSASTPRPPSPSWPPRWSTRPYCWPIRRLEVRRTRYSWLVSGFDSAFILALIALSGGVYSPVVSVLALGHRLGGPAVVQRDAAGGRPFGRRLHSRRADVVAEASGHRGSGAGGRLVGAVSGLRRDHHRRAVRTRRTRTPLRLTALVEAEAEHAAAEEERDLRARLLRSYQSQQDGLQVLVYEFRTPVTSLEALTEALISPHPMSQADRDTSLQLVGRHAAPPGRHARRPVRCRSEPPPDVLGRAGSVASMSPTFIVAAADAVGLAPPRLRLSVSGDVEAVAVNAQGLRRVLTNLLENASGTAEVNRSM